MNQSFESRLSEAISSRRFGEAQEILDTWHKNKAKSRARTLNNLHQEQKHRYFTVDQNYTGHLSAFNDKWERVSNSFNQESSTSREKLRSQLQKEYEQAKLNISKKILPVYKPSAEILNLTKCRDIAVKSKLFKDAKIIQKEINSKLERDKHNYLHKRRSRIQRELINVKRSLSQRIQKFEQRQKEKLDEINIQKSNEINKIQKKFFNIRRSLDNASSIERNWAAAGVFKNHLKAINSVARSSQSIDISCHPRSTDQIYLALF